MIKAETRKWKKLKNIRKFCLIESVFIQLALKDVRLLKNALVTYAHLIEREEVKNDCFNYEMLKQRLFRKFEPIPFELRARHSKFNSAQLKQLQALFDEVQSVEFSLEELEVLIDMLQTLFKNPWVMSEWMSLMRGPLSSAEKLLEEFRQVSELS